MFLSSSFVIAVLLNISFQSFLNKESNTLSYLALKESSNLLYTANKLYPALLKSKFAIDSKDKSCAANAVYVK